MRHSKQDRLIAEFNEAREREAAVAAYLVIRCLNVDWFEFIEAVPQEQAS